MRKIIILALLGGIAFFLWNRAGAALAGPLEATLLLPAVEGLSETATIEAEAAPIGRVRAIAPHNDEFAVSVIVESEHRQRIRTDSLYRVEGDRLVVDSRLAVGKPLVDDAVIRPPLDGLLTRTVQRGRELAGRAGANGGELTRDYEEGRLEERLSEWRKSLSAVAAQGDEAFRRQQEAIRQKMTALEAQLRADGRVAEAERLRQRFDQWRAGTDEGSPSEKSP
jgi:hypothetical protein